MALLAQSQSTPLQAGYLEDWAKMKGIIPQVYVCHRAATPLTVDGRLDEPSWQTAPWTRDFSDIEGDAKPKPRFRTRAKMLWDDNYLYIAAELEEPHVWATLTNHDAVIFHDNDFEVFIDPNGDSHNYYEFEINALNTGWDLLLKKPYKDGGPALNSWEIPGLKTGVQIKGTLNDTTDRDERWTVEMAFPWKALAEYAGRPAPPQEGDQWRVNFSRVEWQIDTANGGYHKVPGRKEDNWVWSPQGIIDMHRPEKWGYVQFTKLEPDQVKFMPDPAAAARAVLQEVYYAQKDFHKANGRWAESLQELGLNNVFSDPLPTLQVTPGGFTGSIDLKLSNNKTQHWHIRQDALIWSE